MSVGENTQIKVTVQTSRGGVDAVDRLAPQWRNLCLEARGTKPFYRPEWIAAYFRAFQPAGELLLLTAYSGDRLACVLPLIEEQSSFCGYPVRKLRGAANVHSCRFDLVRCDGIQGDEAIKEIWGFLRDRQDWDVLEFRDVPQGGALELLLEAARKDGFVVGERESLRSPYIQLAGSESAAVPISSHFRQNLRRRLRKARTQYDVRLRHIERADSDALQQFYRLEHAGWKGREGTAITCTSATRQFYDELAIAAEQFGYLSLYLLDFGDHTVAAHYGLTYEGCYYSPKVAYDENYASYGPGHLIVSAILDDCFQRGLNEFDFLGPLMNWKLEWTQQARLHADRYVFQRGFFGQALYLAKFKMRNGLRRLSDGGRAAALRD